MPILRCPNCGAKLRVDDSAMGKTKRCPQCRHRITIPNKPAPQPERSATAVRRHYFMLGGMAIALVSVGLFFVVQLSPKDQNDRAESEEKTSFPEPRGRVKELVDQLGSPDRETRFNAAIALGEMKSGAVAAIPALVDLATFEEQGSYSFHPTLAAQEALKNIDPPKAVPLLAEALGDPAKRYWSARLLGEWGGVSRPAVPALKMALRERVQAQTANERDATAQAAAALSKIRPEGLSALIGEMEHDHTEVRKLALWATPRGQAGEPTLPTLVRLLSDSDAQVRDSAAKSIVRIGTAAVDWVADEFR